MAVTKIWPVRDNLKRLVEYAENPEKTANPEAALCDVIDYASDGSKTERRLFVTGINCFAESAFKQMSLTKRRFGKEHGVIAHHAYQSFKPGEVTPEQCHQIGVELARRLWGDWYEVLVATHLNTDCCHNHFVLNSVSFVDGRKFNGNRASYYDLREASDELCREYGLSVIEEPSNTKTPRKIFEDEKAGKPTRYNIARQDIEAAVLTSASWQVFLQVMGKLGYEIQVSHTGHLTIKAQGWKYPVRMDSLGSEYAPKNLYHTIMVGNYRYKPIPIPVWFTVHRVRFRGSLQKVKKVTGLRALYFHYCYKLGVLPKEKRHKPLSPEMRHELMKLDKYVEQMKLLTVHKISTVEELSLFREERQSQMNTLIKARSHIDNRRRRCNDPKQKEEYSHQRREFTAQIKALRKDIGTAQAIEDNISRMKELIRIETEQQMQFRPNRNKNRTKGSR